MTAPMMHPRYDRQIARARLRLARRRHRRLLLRFGLPLRVWR